MVLDNIKELAQLGGTVITVFAFIGYLIKKDEQFNKIIQNHLNHSNKVIEKNTQVMKRVAVNLKGLTDIIKQNGRR